MGNIPVVHEVYTSAQCIGDVVTFNPARACERWREYAEESVVGSGVYAAMKYSQGDTERAKELGKGMGRATGQALLGGGLLKDVPVFHELATAGKSLGHMIGGLDDEAAREEWHRYAHESVIGSGVYAAHVALHGDFEKARELGTGMGKAAVKGLVTGTTVAATVVTGGLAAPLGPAAAAAVGGGVGVGAGAVSNVTTQVIDKGKDIDVGDVIGSALVGGVLGAASAYRMAKATAKMKTGNRQAKATAKMKTGKMAKLKAVAEDNKETNTKVGGTAGVKTAAKAITKTAVKRKAKPTVSTAYTKGLEAKVEIGVKAVGMVGTAGATAAARLILHY